MTRKEAIKLGMFWSRVVTRYKPKCHRWFMQGWITQWENIDRDYNRVAELTIVQVVKDTWFNSGARMADRIIREAINKTQQDATNHALQAENKPDIPSIPAIQSSVRSE